MVKNAGGNKSKKMGRKFLTAPVDTKIRLSQEEAEIYAVENKNLGNGMFYANDEVSVIILYLLVVGFWLVKENLNLVPNQNTTYLKYIVNMKNKN